MKDEKKYRFQDNFSGDSYQFASLREAKKVAKKHTWGFPVYIYCDGDIVAVVDANDKPLP